MSICQHHIRTARLTRPYRIPQIYREAVEKEIEMMLREDVIEPCSSEWASPIVVIKIKER